VQATAKGKRRSSSAQRNNQPNNKAGNGKGSNGKASNAQKQRGGAAAHDATTNQKLISDQERLEERGCNQHQEQKGGAAALNATTN
jgi:hypothetical protein